jgi:DNA-binding response OmpR family regulator
MSKKSKILLVDDDPDVVEQVTLILEHEGFEVTAANSSREAEEAVLGFCPDLAILDLMMEKPDSGFVLAFQLRRLYPELPIILLTSVTAQTGLRFDASAAVDGSWIKADRIMDKPVRAEQLLAEVRRLLRIPDAVAAHAH